MLEQKEIEQQINQYLGDILREGIVPEEALIDFCKAMFLRSYGIEALKKVTNEESEILRSIDLNKNIPKSNRNFQWISFCEIYDSFLNKNMREKTGSFYTPKYIIEYMVERTLMIYIHRKTGIIQEALRSIWKNHMEINGNQAREILQIIGSTRIIDIACGTGLFLLESLEKIYQLQKNLRTLLGEEIDTFRIKKSIIETNLFGVDIQTYPIEILKMTLLAYLYDSCQRDSEWDIKLNVLIGDSLLEDMGKKSSGFYRVFHEEKGFDIVIGNPPYLGEKGNKEVFQKIQSTDFGKKYYEGKMDYFYFFIYRGLEILKDQGLLTYITTNYFVTADGATHLRQYLRKSCTFLEFVNFNEFEVFKSAKGQHNMIFFLERGYQGEVPIQIKYIKERKLKEEQVYHLLQGDRIQDDQYSCYQMENQDKLYGMNGHMHVQGEEASERIIEKIMNSMEYQLGELCSINQGIVSGADKVTQEMLDKKLSMNAVHKYGIKLNEGIFVLDKKEVEALGLEQSPYLKPMYKNSDIYRYRAKEEEKRYVLYLTDTDFLEIEKHSKIIEHLYRFKEVLDHRRETMQGRRKWYSLQWPRQKEIFEREKIIVPQRGKENRFAFSNVSWYASADVYFITTENSEIDLKFLLAQLNSKLIYFWLYNRGKRKGADLELYANPLKGIPILLNVDPRIRIQLIALVDQMMENENNVLIQATLDMYLYKLYGLSEQDIEIIETLHRNNVNK